MKKLKPSRVKLPKGEERIGEGANPKLVNKSRIQSISKLVNSVKNVKKRKNKR